MPISKPTVGSIGWNTNVDAVIDRVNAIDSNIGTGAEGSYATIAARLAAMEARLPAQTTSVLPTGSVPGNWELVFRDEFTGSSLDSTKWTPNLQNGDGQPLNGINCYIANTTVTGGNAVMTLAGLNNGALFHTGYTADRFQLPVGGYTEARIYLPGNSTVGIFNWPTWWTVGDFNIWPIIGENDIIESGSGNATVNYHGGTSAAHVDHQATIGGTWYNGWHTYGVHRKAATSDYYFDGTLVATHATAERPDSPHELFFNLLHEEQWGNTVTGVNSQVKVDYCRAWTPVGGRPTVINRCTNPAFEIDTNADGVADGWEKRYTGLGTFSRIASPWNSGQAQRFVASAAGQDTGINYGSGTAPVAVTPGQVVTAVMRYTGPGARLLAGFDWFNGGTYVTSDLMNVASNTGIDTYLRVSATAPSGVTGFALDLTTAGMAALSGDTHVIDNVTLVVSDRVWYDIQFDGNTTAGSSGFTYSWSGTPNASTSVRTPVTI